MTLSHLPAPAHRSASVEDRLTSMEARIDVVIEGIREILAEVVALRLRVEEGR